MASRAPSAQGWDFLWWSRSGAGPRRPSLDATALDTHSPVSEGPKNAARVSLEITGSVWGTELRAVHPERPRDLLDTSWATWY